MDSGGTRVARGAGSDPAQRLRASNRRTALILAAIAAVFFAGIIATRWMGGEAVGIGIMSVVVILFLVVAIGRNVRSTDERAGQSPGPKGASARDSARPTHDGQRYDDLQGGRR